MASIKTERFHCTDPNTSRTIQGFGTISLTNNQTYEKGTYLNSGYPYYWTIYVIEGEITGVCNNVTFSAKEGDTVNVSANEICSFQKSASSPKASVAYFEHGVTEI